MGLLIAGFLSISFFFLETLSLHATRVSTPSLSCATLYRLHHSSLPFSKSVTKKCRILEPSIDSFLSAGRRSRAMLNVEKVLKDLNLRLAHFGDSDIATAGPLSSHNTDGSEAQRLRLEIAARLGFKTD